MKVARVPWGARSHEGCAGAVVSEGTLWIQRAITLDPRPRGFHLVTGELLAELPELSSMAAGMLHLLIQHTSASLALNENASPDVRRDFETWFNQAVPERASYWTHTLEGPDDMPAHVKEIGRAHV